MSELRLTLTRAPSQQQHTFGVLSNSLTGAVYCETMEPGTNDREFPRVPTGFYALEPHSSQKEWIGETWALVGENVAHFPTLGVDRFAILIHPGNVDDDTLGCIIPGMRRGIVNNESAVVQSRVAMDLLREKISTHERAYLTIR